MSAPLLCPRCGDAFRFSSVPELRVHLITRHTYETLLLLSQTGERPSRPRPLLLPLPAPTETAQAGGSTLGGSLQESPRPLEGLDLALSTSPAPALPWSRLTEQKCLHAGMFLQSFLTVDIGLEERLGLGLGFASRAARTLAEVEERVERNVERLRSRLRHKEALLRRQRDTEGKLRAERQELDTRVVRLSGQVSAAEELMDRLRNELQDRETELHHKQQEMEQIESFLRGLAQKEAEAKVKLQVFIESLLDRAERAERQVLLLTSPEHHHFSHDLSHDLDQALSRASLDELLTRRLQEANGNRRSFSLSDSDRLQLHSVWDCAPTRTLSLGSPDEDASPNTARFVEGGWGQTWSKPSRRRHGNEEEEDGEAEDD